MQDFNTVGIIGFVDKLLIKDTVSRLARFLVSEGITALLEKETWTENGTPLEDPPEKINFCSRSEMAENCDLVVVVGGDGSLLHAARDFADSNTPILGVNRGRLGFLTDVAPHELEHSVANVLNGNCASTDRFLLETEVIRDGEVVFNGIALNDVVLRPRDSIRMIEFALKIDGMFVYSQRADGLIVSTPTGSTAYALSGGGSILHPALDAINIVPINPHTLSNRPIVVNSDAQLEIVLEKKSRIEAQVVCDGQEYMDAELGDSILVRRKANALRLLHPVEHDFYAICRSKLKWAND